MLMQGSPGLCGQLNAIRLIGRRTRTHSHADRVGDSLTPQIEASALRAWTGLALCISSTGFLLVYFKISFIINWSMCFPQFCKPLQQINSTQGEGVRPSLVAR
jgi:hypothetical protein